MQGSDGRDHNPYGFSLWLAGGGVKGGTVFGATGGRDFRLTDVHGSVIRKILA